MIGKKIVCMRKNGEINCLPQRCSWKKIVCRDHLCYARFGKFKKKIVCTARVEEKKLASAQSMVEKNFLPPRNHDTPRGKIMVRPLRGKEKCSEGDGDQSIIGDIPIHSSRKHYCCPLSYLRRP